MLIGACPTLPLGTATVGTRQHLTLLQAAEALYTSATTSPAVTYSTGAMANCHANGDSVSFASLTPAASSPSPVATTAPAATTKVATASPVTTAASKLTTPGTTTAPSKVTSRRLLQTGTGTDAAAVLPYDYYATTSASTAAPTGIAASSTYTTSDDSFTIQALNATTATTAAPATNKKATSATTSAPATTKASTATTVTTSTTSGGTTATGAFASCMHHKRLVTGLIATSQDRLLRNSTWHGISRGRGAAGIMIVTDVLQFQLAVCVYLCPCPCKEEAGSSFHGLQFKRPWVDTGSLIQLVHSAGNTNLNKFPACGDAVYLYPSSTVTDDLLWAASWMYAATTTNSYLTDAVGFYQSFMTNNQDGEACRPVTHVHLAVILHCQESALGMHRGMHCRYTASNALPATVLSRVMGLLSTTNDGQVPS